MLYGLRRSVLDVGFGSLQKPAEAEGRNVDGGKWERTDGGREERRKDGLGLGWVGVGDSFVMVAVRSLLLRPSFVPSFLRSL